MAEPCPTCGQATAAPRGWFVACMAIGGVLGLLLGQVTAIARRVNPPFVAPIVTTPTVTVIATKTATPMPTATSKTPTPTRSRTPVPTATPKPLRVDRVTDHGVGHTAVVFTYTNVADESFERVEIECTALDKSENILGVQTKTFWNQIDGTIYPGFRRTEKVYVRTDGADVDSARCRIVLER